MRTLADLPAYGQRVILQVAIRRYFCLCPACPRLTFAEPLPAVTRPHARKTLRLLELLARVALVLGGEAGARSVRTAVTSVSPATLLRCIRQATLQTPASLSVAGVDEWAWHKGQNYGTIVVDLK